MAAEELVKEAMIKKSLDNVTAIIICFGTFGYKSQVGETINGKTMYKSNVKIPQRWEHHQSENEIITHFRSAEKSQSMVIKNPITFTPNNNEALPEVKEIPKPFSPKRGIEFIKNLPFEKLNLNIVEPQRKTSTGFPKITAIRTPR